MCGFSYCCVISLDDNGVMFLWDGNSGGSWVKCVMAYSLQLLSKSEIVSEHKVKNTYIQNKEIYLKKRRTAEKKWHLE